MPDNAHAGEPDLQEIWTRCLSAADAPVRSMLEADAVPLALDGPRFQVGVPPFQKDFLTRSDHKARLDTILRQVMGRDHLILEFVLSDPATSGSRPAKRETAEARRPQAPPAPPEFEGTRLRTDLTFESFVRGNCNSLAAAAAQAVADSPAKAFNPLFIYGGSGLGKTHLMNAIGNVILSRNRRSRVVYISAERFANELIESIGDSQMKEFRRKFRYVDVLLIVDVQFLIN